eukprot:TRINITY_DN6010_c4_g1_i1.p1 TRINITY_DN6010_c4_g1~~TRINITY_DN6010_c4_g1_i1.p1  ORF type:complete len:2027 (+),score=310.05 TRINITY_DN6010_c4_g1_i1:77-6082(+)
MQFAQSAVNWIADKVLRFVVKRVLNRFLKKLDPEQFAAFSFQKGVFSLHKLEFDTEVVNKQLLAGLPVKLAYGRVGQLDISWSLQTLGLTFCLKEVDIVLDYIAKPEMDQSQGGLGARMDETAKAEDLLARSLVLGDVSRQDVKDLSGTPDREEQEEQYEEEEEEEDELQSAKVKELIDKAVQKMKIVVKNGNISLRFPSQTQPGMIDILRVEIPWLEFHDKDIPSPDKLTGKLFCKILTFQAFVVYLHTVKADADLLSSTLMSPRSMKTTQSEIPSDVSPDVIFICVAEDRNTVELTFPSDRSVARSQQSALKLVLFLQSIHCIVGSRNLQILRGIADLISMGSDEAAASSTPQHADEPPVSITVHVMHFAAAILLADQTPLPDIWDPLLELIEPEPRPSSSGPARNELNIKSPCKDLPNEHILIEASQIGRSSGVLARISAQPSGTRVEIALSVVNVCWKVHSQADIPNVLKGDVTVDKATRMVSRRLVKFQTVKTKTGEQRPQVTIMVTTTCTREGTVTTANQNIRVRMSPRVVLYTPWMRDFMSGLTELISPSVKSPHEDYGSFSVGRTSSCGSLQSCEGSRMTPTRRPCSPMSPISSTSDFDDAFRERDGYKRFQAAPVPPPPPPPYQPPTNVTRSVTFGSSTVHSPSQPCPPIRFEPAPPQPRNSLLVQRDLHISGKFEIVAYFESKEKEELTLIGPYLQSILDFHSEGDWLGCMLKLKLDDCDVVYNSSAWLDPPPTADANPNSVLKMTCTTMKICVDRLGREDVIASFDGGKMGMERSGVGGSTVRQARPANILVTFKSKTDPATCAAKSRVAEMLKEEDEETMAAECTANADVHVAFTFPSAAVTLKKDEVLLVQYMIADLTENMSSPDVAFQQPDGMTMSGIGTLGAIPLSLLNTPAAGLKPWQTPKSVVAVTLSCQKVIFDIHAPMCFPSDAPPLHTVPYPDEPPCYKYTLTADEFSLFTATHLASDSFTRVGVTLGGLELLEHDGANSLLTHPVLRNYHNLYRRSTKAGRVKDSGLRIVVSYAQCSPANPAYLLVRDRQDMRVTVEMNKLVLSHQVKQDANNWVLVLTELFTDVLRVDSMNETSSDDEGSLSGTPTQGRLRATRIDVTANSTIIDYSPNGLSSRVLIAADKISFGCLVVMLSEEFRAEIGIDGATMLLDNGHFKKDLVSYDMEASSKSLFGKSKGGMLTDLELLGFISVLETTDSGLKIVIKTMAPTTDCVPHLRGRGVGERKGNDIEVSEEAEQHKPFVVEVTGGGLKTDCCSDSFKLFQDSIIHYLSGEEQNNLKPIAEYYKEALGLPIEEEEIPIARVDSVRSTSAKAVQQAAKDIQAALQTSVPDMGFTTNPIEKGGTLTGEPIVVHDCHYSETEFSIKNVLQHTDGGDLSARITKLDMPDSISGSAATLGQHFRVESNEDVQIPGHHPDTDSSDDDSFQEIDYHNEKRRDDELQLFRESLPEYETSLVKEAPLIDFVEEDYFSNLEAQTSRLRCTKSRKGDPTPTLQLIVSGVSWTCNLYGGKDFVAALSPDAVHHKLQGMHSTVSIKKAGQLYRTTRVYSQLVTLHAESMFILLDMFNPLGTDEGYMWRLKGGSRTLDVIDKLSVSSRNKIVTAVNSIDDQSDVFMVEVEAKVAAALAGTKDAPKHSEMSLELNLEPLRVNIDQDALEFLERFFSGSSYDSMVVNTSSPSPPMQRSPHGASSSSPPAATANRGETVHLMVEGAGGIEEGIYFKTVKIGKIHIKLDYSSKRCSLSNILNVEPLELLNLVNIEGMVIELDEVSVDGCWSTHLPMKLAEKWWEAIHIAELLSGVPTVRSVTRIGHEAVNLVSAPYEEYRQGNNPFSGLPHAFLDFLCKFTVEAVHLTEQAAIIGGGIVSAGVNALETPQDEDAPPPPASYQPATAYEGLRQGLETANDELHAGVKVLNGLPQVIRDGYIVLLARSLCLVMLKPMRGIFRGWCAVAQGSMTALDPERRAEHTVLYKLPRDPSLDDIN